MPKAKPKPKKRDRTGYVMVELDDDHRKMLEALRKDRSGEIGEPTSLAATVRSLIRAKWLEKNLANLPPLS